MSTEMERAYRITMENEIDISRQRHAGDLEEKRRLDTFQAEVVHRRDSEYKRLIGERQAHFNQIIQARKQDRETRRKMLYYLRSEEERLRRQREEEEVRNREESERRRKEEAERQAKLNEIAEKQRQRERELEEKEKKWKEEVLGKTAVVSPRPVNPPVEGSTPELVTPAPVTAQTPGKYVPKHKRMPAESSAVQPPPETDRWGAGGGKPDDQPSWRDERRPSAFGSGPPKPSTWSSSRPRPR